MRGLARVVIGLVLVSLPSLAHAASGSGRVLAPDCSKAVYKPRHLILSCGDGSNQLTRLTWSRWTARTAAGSGIDLVNNCTPDCVRGHFQMYPAIVTLSQPKSCRHMRRHAVFGRIVLRYTGAHPGRSRTVAASLACPF